MMAAQDKKSQNGHGHSVEGWGETSASLEQETVNDPITLLTTGIEWPIFTPFGNEAAAQILLGTLKRAPGRIEQGE
jgi:hypothetical protein